MKCLLTGILLFIVTNCFAIDQNLVDADEQYFDAQLKLPRIEKEIIDTKHKLEKALWNLNWEENKLGEFRSKTSIEYYRLEVEEKQKMLTTLTVQQIETKKLLQKLKPLKVEYDRQYKSEIKHQELTESIIATVTISIFITIFVLMIWFAIAQHKKYKKLLKEEKITQEEYDRIKRVAMLAKDFRPS